MKVIEKKAFYFIKGLKVDLVKRNLKQTDLANHLGISNTTVSKIVNGKYAVREFHLKGIKSFLKGRDE